MNRSKPRLILIGIVILLAGLACAVPGLSPQSAPTTDPNSIATIVAGTAQVLAQQTVQAYLSTPTSPPEPTAMLIPTETPEVSAIGTSLRVNDDGNTVFTDTQAGYEITLLPGWLTVRVNEKEYFEALSSPVVTGNPAFQRSLDLVAKEDPKTHRLFAFDILEEHRSDKFNTNLLLIVDPGGSTLEQDMRDIQNMNQSSVPGLKIIKSEIITNSSGVQVGLINMQWDAQTPNGDVVTLFQKQVVFKPVNGTVGITFSTLNDIKDKTLAIFDPIIDTIRILR